MAARSRGPNLLVGGRSNPIDPKTEDTTMNNWYATDRIAKQRRADFQREADVESLLTSLEDLGEPDPGTDRPTVPIHRSDQGEV